MKSFISLLLAFLSPFGLMAFPTERTLHEGWQFRQGSSELWHPATVPGCVHLDLMANRIIDDPFYRLNDRSVQWIDKEDWVYKTSFRPTEGELSASNQQIVFYGLDTYADVYLNHRLLTRTDNMHRTWRIDVKGIMQGGDNILEVYFHSPIKRNIPKFDSLNYRHNTGPDHSQFGGIFDKTISPFARTAGYEYGWDWGSRFVTSGIWRPVKLLTWNGARINDVWVIQKDVNRNRAQLRTLVEVSSDTDQPGAKITLTADGRKVATETADLHKGLNTLTMDYVISHPRLWWTNGLGEPYLYTFHTTLTAGTATDVHDERIGIRSLKLHNDKDKWGHNLYFELNGEPLYAKGANVVPSDNFLTRCTDSVYHRLVKDARDVNMNILRVWGGGIYEDDAFYRYCDEMGILVWQDFMFACQTYEVDSAFLATVRQEAIDNVKRLRNHACIAVYTGNNEEQDVWFGWGNKKKYFDELGQGERVWKMQHSIFYETLPEVVRQYGGGTSYRPSSPWATENGPSDGVNGDDHYWGVWHGAEPFEAYFDHHVRFESEYGFQSFPDYESVLRYNPDPRDHNIYSEVMMEHQNAGTYANRRIEEYMRRYYRVPSDFRRFLYVGQVMQADGVKMGMEAFRRDRPYCMGGMVWQINDCWPVASWSSRDYYGRWKALHYFMRPAYADILVSPCIYNSGSNITDPNKHVAALPTNIDHAAHISSVADTSSVANKVLNLKLVNDRRSKVSGTLTIQTMTIDGETIHETRRSIAIPANNALEVGNFSIPQLLHGHDAADCVIVITFNTKGKLYRNIAYALPQKEMRYRKPAINLAVVPSGDGYDVTVGTNIFARALCLYTKGTDDFFSDNYFDLLPHEQRSIHVSSKKSLDAFRSELRWMTLGDEYE